MHRIQGLSMMANAALALITEAIGSSATSSNDIMQVEQFT